MLLNLTLVGYKEFCRSWGVLSNSAFYGGPCKHKEHVKKNQLLHTANKKETVKNYAHCKQNSRALQTKKNLTVKKCTLQAKELDAGNKTPARCKQERNCKKDLHTASKRITRCKQNPRTLQTKLPHAANKSKSTASAG